MKCCVQHFHTTLTIVHTSRRAILPVVILNLSTLSRLKGITDFPVGIDANLDVSFTKNPQLVRVMRKKPHGISDDAILFISAAIFNPHHYRTFTRYGNRKQNAAIHFNKWVDKHTVICFNAMTKHVLRAHNTLSSICFDMFLLGISRRSSILSRV